MEKCVRYAIAIAIFDIIFIRPHKQHYLHKRMRCRRTFMYAFEIQLHQFHLYFIVSFDS